MAHLSSGSISIASPNSALNGPLDSAGNSVWFDRLNQLLGALECFPRA